MARRAPITGYGHYLTLFPRLAARYLLQVGDSRCYLLRRGELTQIPRDQRWLRS